MNMEKLVELDLSSPDVDIAIIGMACRFPDANHYLDYWDNLLNGKDSISEMPVERMLVDLTTSHNIRGGFINNVDKFDAGYFGISPREAINMDPQQRIMLELASECIDDANYKKEDISGKNIGVFLGIGNFDYKALQDRNTDDIDRYYTTGNLNSIIANRLSYFFNFHGPSVVVDAACASSLVAIHQAVSSIKLGECDSALAGGVSLLLSGERYISFAKMEMLSSTGNARAFDNEANGYVRGEGAGVVFLKRLDAAVKDKNNILAVIKGGAVNHNGRGRSLTSPNAIAQSKVIRAALKNAKICPSTVTYVESHGTGTPLGDPIEILGLKRAFDQALKESSVQKKNYCAIGAVKNNIGHLEPAAGVASVIKVVLALKNKTIPQNIQIRDTNKKIEFNGSPFYLVTSNEKWVNLKDDHNNTIPLRAGISAFGIGGINSHILIEEYCGASIGLPDVKPLSKFERNSYWMNQNKSEHLNSNYVNYGTSLIGDKIDLPVDVECYQTTLSVDSLPYLWDHVINGKPVFPGAGFIASALSIAHASLNKSLMLTDIQLIKFIPLQQGTLINTTLSIADKSIRLWSKNPVVPLLKDDASITWNLNASATVSEYIKGSECFSQQEKFTGTILNVDEIYNEMKTLGLEYGDQFRVLTSIQCAGDVSVCEIRTLYEGEDINSYVIHPVMLDGIMQAAYPILRTKTNTQWVQTIFPVSIKSSYFSEPVRAQASVKAICTEYNDNFALFDFYIYVDGNREIGVITGLKLSIMNKVSDDLDILYQPEWQLEKKPSESHEANIFYKNDYAVVIDLSARRELNNLLTKNGLPENIITYISGDATDTNCWNLMRQQFSNAMASNSNIRTIYYFASDSALQSNNTLIENCGPAYSEYNFIIELINSISKLSAGNKIRLKFVTDKAFTLADISSCNPFSSAIYGLCRTACAEYENLEAVHVDVNYDEVFLSAKEFFKKIEAEPASKNVNLAAWRGSDRFIRILKEYSIGVNQETRFSHHGTYIIVGGAGGIGYQLSIEIAKKYSANLILIGRSEIDTSLREKLDYLTSCGGNVSYYRADLTNVDQLSAVINACYEKYEKIDVVLHSAVSLNDQHLVDIDESSLYKSLDAKVKGSINLLNALQNRNVGALVYFSSVAAFYPSVGQAAYTVGNIFQNSLVDYMQKNSDVSVKSVSWGPWNSIGIVANENVKANLISLGFGFLDTAEAMSILDKFLASDLYQLVVCRAEDSVKALMGIPTDHDDSLSVVFQRSSDNYLYDWLHEQFTTILKMRKTNAVEFKEMHQASYLSEMGVDSLAAMELRAKIKNRFMIDFSIEILLGATRLGELVEKMHARIQELSANKNSSSLNTEVEDREVFVI